MQDTGFEQTQALIIAGPGWQKVLKDLQQNPKDRLIYNKTLAFFHVRY